MTFVYLGSFSFCFVVWFISLFLLIFDLVSQVSWYLDGLKIESVLSFRLGLMIYSVSMKICACLIDVGPLSKPHPKVKVLLMFI